MPLCLLTFCPIIHELSTFPTCSFTAFTSSIMTGDVKRICETDIGLVSQCCLAKHVFRMSKQYLADVALKINVKVGIWMHVICSLF